MTLHETSQSFKPYCVAVITSFLALRVAHIPLDTIRSILQEYYDLYRARWPIEKYLMGMQEAVEISGSETRLPDHRTVVIKTNPNSQCASSFNVLPNQSKEEVTQSWNTTELGMQMFSMHYRGPFELLSNAMVRSPKVSLKVPIASLEEYTLARFDRCLRRLIAQLLLKPNFAHLFQDEAETVETLANKTSAFLKSMYNHYADERYPSMIEAELKLPPNMRFHHAYNVLDFMENDILSLEFENKNGLNEEEFCTWLHKHCRVVKAFIRLGRITVKFNRGRCVHVIVNFHVVKVVKCPREVVCDEDTDDEVCVFEDTE